jgi:hypothetical protein
MTLRSIFVDPPQPERSAGLRYGFLALVGALLAWNAYLLVTRRPGVPGDPYGGMIIGGMLLFNHVAFQFHLPPRVTVAARILAISWLAFGSVYIGYLGPSLYPL